METMKKGRVKFALPISVTSAIVVLSEISSSPINGYPSLRAAAYIFSSFFEYNRRFFLIGSSYAPFKNIPARGTFAVTIADHTDGTSQA